MQTAKYVCAAIFYAPILLTIQESDHHIGNRDTIVSL